LQKQTTIQKEPSLDTDEYSQAQGAKAGGGGGGGGTGRGGISSEIPVVAGGKRGEAEWGGGGGSRSEGVLGNATQCLRFTLSEEVFCFIRNMECCQAISQSRGALKVVKEPY
jgi:hypothetical protein